jgi:hypothetical protein
MSGYARKTDPETSHEAGAGVTRSERVYRQKVLLERVFEQVYPETLIPSEAVELAGLEGLPFGSPWHRVTDLWHDGALYRTGETRRWRKTNKPQNVHAWIPPVQRVPPSQRQTRTSRPIDFVRWVIAVGDDDELRRELTLQQIIDRARTYVPREERHME